MVKWSFLYHYTNAVISSAEGRSPRFQAYLAYTIVPVSSTINNAGKCNSALFKAQLNAAAILSNPFFNISLGHAKLSLIYPAP